MLYDMIAYDMRVHRTMYFNDLFVNIKRAALFIIWGRSSFHVIQFGSQICFQSTPIKTKQNETKNYDFGFWEVLVRALCMWILFTRR